MKFLYHSELAKQAFIRFRSSTLESNDFVRQNLFKRACLCSYKITLIGLDTPEYDQIKSPQEIEIYQHLQKAWKAICENNVESLAYQAAYQEIKNSGSVVLEEPIPKGIEKHGKILFFNLTLLRSPDDPENHFYILLKGSEETGIPLYFISYLSNMWVLEQGNLPVHSAVITKGGNAYLFSGPSGSGKSTIAEISQELKYHVLDEDQNIIRRIESGLYTCDGWGYRVVSGFENLRAIFFIEQSSENSLSRIDETLATKKLFNCHLQIMSRLPDKLLIKSFKTTSAIAHQIPAYDLQFQKNKAFWEMIDEDLIG